MIGRCALEGTVIIAAALGACATPYQRMGFSGGFDESRLPNGDWVVTVKVNGYTGREVALQYLHRRAGELCPAGYDMVDRTDGDNGGVTISRCYVGQTHKPEVDAVVRCKDPEAEVAALRAKAEAARKAEAPAPPPRGFFCSSSPSNSLASFCERKSIAVHTDGDGVVLRGAVFVDAGTCVARRDHAVAAGETPEECDEEP